MPRVADGEEVAIRRDVVGRLGRRRGERGDPRRAPRRTVRPSRYSSRCICLTAAIRSAQKPRRRRPSALKPRTASGLPSTIMNGGTSCDDVALEADHRVRADRARTGAGRVRPPTIAQSPSCTWPASVALLAMIVLVADLAVVRDVDVGHDPVVVADARDAGVLRGADVEACRTRGSCCGRRSRARSARRRTSCPAASRRSRRTGRCGCRGRSWCGPRSRSAGRRGAGADAHVRRRRCCRRRPRRRRRARAPGSTIAVGWIARHRGLRSARRVRTVHISSASTASLAVDAGARAGT